MTTDFADPTDPLPDTDEPDTDEPTAGGAVERAIRAAERLLTARLGAQIRLDDPEVLGGSGRSTVLRVRVAHTPFTLPRTLVIKHSPPRSPMCEVDLFAQEAASCQLFTALRREDRPGPELIACGATARLLVLEDLGRSGTVASLLHSTVPHTASRAEQALLKWAHALGRLHATTRNRERDFAALLRRLGS
ncbi:MAG: phosphotransferase, partial [Pseudonocardiaceae bacterium]